MANYSQQIWLIRHGETAWSHSGQHTGRTDLPLLPEAEPIVQALAPHVQKHSFSLVLSSPLKRAQQTASLVGFKSFELDDRLMEWNYGDFNGKTKEEIRQIVPDWSIWRDGVHNGETLQDVALRAKGVLDRAQSVSGDVALVAHGHLLRILSTVWLGQSPEQAEHLALSTASICVLGWEDEYPVLLQWNWRPD